MSITKSLTMLAALSAVAFASIANAEVVVVVSASNSKSSMTADEVADVFLGKSSGLTPINQSEGSALRNEFFTKVAGKDASQVKAIWTKLIFTGKSIPPKEVASSADVKKAVSGDAKAIGYVDKGSVDSSVKVVLTLP